MSFAEVLQISSVMHQAGLSMNIGALRRARPYSITMVATHAPVLAQVSDLRNTFRNTQGKLELGHV